MFGISMRIGSSNKRAKRMANEEGLFQAQFGAQRFEVLN